MVNANDPSSVSTLNNRHYEAASKDGAGAGWNAKDITPESETSQNEEIEKRARDLVRNSPIARTITDSHEQQIMHGGVALLVQGQSRRIDEIKKLIMETLNSSQLDTNQSSSFNELLALVIRETSITGNCLALRVIDKTAPLGFRIKLLEYAYVDRKMNGKEGRNRVVRGVELDAKDRPVAYWLKPSIEPGDTRKAKRYAIDEIGHTYVPTRVGALDGICWFAPAIMHIRMLEDILISAQQRQAAAQAFTAFIKLPHGYEEERLDRDIIKRGKKNSDKPDDTDDRGFARSTRADEKMRRKIKNDEYVRGLSEIRPNTFYILRPGEEIELAAPPAPIDLAAIIKPIVMFISKSTGLSYETILGDFSNGSYSATRMSNIQPVLWTKSRREMITNRFLQKVWAWIVDGLDTKGYDMTGIEHKWQFPEIVSAHPKEDLEMTWDRIHHNAGTVSEYIRSTNRDPDMVFKERAEELRKMKELGLDAANIGESAGASGKRSAAKSNSDRTAQEGAGSSAGREQLQ